MPAACVAGAKRFVDTRRKCRPSPTRRSSGCAVYAPGSACEAAASPRATLTWRKVFPAAGPTITSLVGVAGGERVLDPAHDETPSTDISRFPGRQRAMRLLWAIGVACLLGACGGSPVQPGAARGHPARRGASAPGRFLRLGRKPECRGRHQYAAPGALQIDAGLLVRQATGAARSEGIRAGDLIVAINDVRLEHVEDFTHTLSRMLPGRTVALLVMRDRRLAYVPVRIPERRSRPSSRWRPQAARPVALNVPSGQERSCARGCPA